MTKFNADRSIFLVYCRTSGGELFVNEANPFDDRATILADLISGQYMNPQRVVEFNEAEGWVRNISEDLAREWFKAEHDQWTVDDIPPFVSTHFSDAEDELRESIANAFNPDDERLTGRQLGVGAAA